MPRTLARLAAAAAFFGLSALAAHAENPMVGGAPMFPRRTSSRTP